VPAGQQPATTVEPTEQPVATPAATTTVPATPTPVGDPTPVASTPMPAGAPALAAASTPSSLAPDAATGFSPQRFADNPAADGPARPPSARIAEILASGAPAALLATLARDLAAPQPLLSAATRRALATKTAERNRGASMKPTPAGTGGGGQGPPPAGPPGSASAGGGSGAPGGLSSAQWCVVIVILLALTGQELRRFRLRVTLATPSGFEPLLQRPG
jgi:hypothetical protein